VRWPVPNWCASLPSARRIDKKSGVRPVAKPDPIPVSRLRQMVTAWHSPSYTSLTIPMGCHRIVYSGGVRHSTRRSQFDNSDDGYRRSMSVLPSLRATLSGSRAAEHPLRAEFSRTRDYLSLMQVRMEDRLQTHFELPDALADIPVPPLLLHPLVENSIKHGLEPSVTGGHRCQRRAGGHYVGSHSS